MSKNKAHHHSIKVNCTMDEPIELLVDKLSSKSTDLYVFWVYSIGSPSKTMTTCIGSITRKSARTVGSRRRFST